MDSKEIIRILEADGWVLKKEKKAIITMYPPLKPHPKRQMPMGTLISIEKQACLKLRRVK
jgi:predicted RNA binding protein YcfA (HicA-like mRNA interferase family)